MSNPTSPQVSPKPQAGKRPRSTSAYEEVEDDLVAELPDLASYFDEFGVKPIHQITICRNYASLLAALLRTQNEEIEDIEGEGKRKSGKGKQKK